MSKLPFEQYDDFFSYISDEQVKEAFKYIIQHSKKLPNYTIHSRPTTFIKRNVHYYNKEGNSPYSFIANKKSLLFYLRQPRITHPKFDCESLKIKLPNIEIKQNNGGEFTLRIRNIDNAKRIISFVFSSYDDFLFPDEVTEDISYLEGATTQITVNNYERNSIARSKCIEKHGYDCSVCNFNFEQKYGELGKGFIHVHHLRALASIQKEYQIDPIKDLRPVCPNCHAMLHRKNPILSIEELKAIIESSSVG
ncbi:HNH endonuclease [Deefgea rivuli]|uniref:HNH endonuclease n=1 Tax=Deefgea rivuli TaxID=400948 RepID=UPI000A0746BC|nr:HNH endonuclease [Deefgea rivuli]